MPYKDPEKARAAARLGQQRWKARHPDRARASAKASYDKHADKKRADARAYYHANRAKVLAAMRVRHLRKRYGLTVEEYNALGSACSICGDLPRGTGKNKALHVDHDAVSGKVRGVLCNACNCGIGYFRHDPERMKKGIQYLEHHSACLT